MLGLIIGLLVGIFNLMFGSLPHEAWLSATTFLYVWYWIWLAAVLVIVGLIVLFGAAVGGAGVGLFGMIVGFLFGGSIAGFALFWVIVQRALLVFGAWLLMTAPGVPAANGFGNNMGQVYLGLVVIALTLFVSMSQRQRRRREAVRRSSS